jgi:cytochrome c553
MLLAVACATATTQNHMVEHFQRVDELQNAAIRGNAETVRDAARWLADHEDAGKFPGWADSYFRAFADRAASLAEARAPAAVATETGLLLRACGACHEAVPSGPTITVADPEPGGNDVGSHMVRHFWAVDRMGAGLIGPSEDSWEQGLAALVEMPLDATDLYVDPAHAEEAGEIGVRLHGMAWEARDLRDWDDRAEAYGRMIYQCASCHSHRVQVGGT